MYRVVIDANVWVKLARAKNIAPLIDRFTAYDLVPLVNNYLLSEVFEAIVENGWLSEKSTHQIIAFIRSNSVRTTETSVFRLSPDPKDNYLFDLAIQNNCAFIVSDDILLLSFRIKPIDVHSSSWFMKMFPIE